MAMINHSSQRTHICLIAGIIWQMALFNGVSFRNHINKDESYRIEYVFLRGYCNKVRVQTGTCYIPLNLLNLFNRR